jgi:GntR family transcriptional regulator, N-acetylglucosamine utilization regulator
LKIVDESNPMPKYLQISSWLKDLIQTGRYSPGEKLPSEMELSKTCGVNRNTLRQAVSELISQGLVRREKGLGTFVTTAAPTELRHTLERISSYRDLMEESGVEVQTDIVSKGLEPADSNISGALILGVDKSVFAIRRLRLGDGIPYIYEETFVPAAVFDGILDMDLMGSLYQIYTDHFNVTLARSHQTIRATNLDQKLADIFDLPMGSATIFIETITYNENGAPIELLYSYHRGDKYKLEIELSGFSSKGNRFKLKTG